MLLVLSWIVFAVVANAGQLVIPAYIVLLLLCHALHTKLRQTCSDSSRKQYLSRRWAACWFGERCYLNITTNHFLQICFKSIVSAVEPHSPFTKFECNWVSWISVVRWNSLELTLITGDYVDAIAFSQDYFFIFQ